MISFTTWFISYNGSNIDVCAWIYMCDCELTIYIYICGVGDRYFHTGAYMHTLSMRIAGVDESVYIDVYMLDIWYIYIYIYIYICLFFKRKTTIGFLKNKNLEKIHLLCGFYLHWALYQEYLNLIFDFWIFLFALIGIIPYSRFTGLNNILICIYIYIYIYKRQSVWGNLGQKFITQGIHFYLIC